MCPGGLERVRCSQRGLSSFGTLSISGTSASDPVEEIMAAEAADCVVAGESDDRIRSLGAVEKMGPGAPAAWRRSAEPP
jgi:hypothetical protein